MLRTTFCRALLKIPGHRICCRIPVWTAYVGQKWDTYDVAPWNLYNVWWRFGQWLVLNGDVTIDVRH